MTLGRTNWRWLILFVVGVATFASLNDAQAHSYNQKNQINRRHKAVWGATTGNFRRKDIMSALQNEKIYVRPLARALGQSHANQIRRLDKVLHYQEVKKEVIQMVGVWGGAAGGGSVTFVAAPLDKSKPCRVMSEQELAQFGIRTQKKALGYAERLKGTYGKAGTLKPAGMSYSGLSYGGYSERPVVGPQGNQVIQTDVTVPITAKLYDLSGSTIYQWKF